MYRIIKCLTVIIVVCTTIFNINYVSAALYASKGDKIPISTIEYDKDDNLSVFPESYKQDLAALKKAHPNWTFMAIYTNLDWKQTIMHECYEINMGISLVPMSYAAEWKKDGKNYFQDGTWVTASKAAVAYAIDPRNYLSESGIFQFESLSCVEGVHTVEAVEKVLAGTDLETKYTTDESGKRVKDYPTFVNINNVTVKMEKTYAELIYEAGKESGVSPMHIATRIIQETGGRLANGSICGTNENYVGYYNFFNIGATPGADGNSAVTNGLITAKNNGWDSPEKSIKAGSLTLYNSYIKYGQDTIYFQKFDVSNSKGNAKMLYANQYMTNIMATVSEAKLTYDAYLALGIVDSNFVFYIPVFDNRTLEKAPPPGKTIDENNIEQDKKEEETPKVVNVKSISFAKTNYTIAKGSSINVEAVILPENATDKTYTSKSQDSKIAQVKGNKVTGVKEGKTKVTFETKDGGYKATIDITVIDKETFEISDNLKINDNNEIIDLHSGTTVKDILDNIHTSDSVKIECRNVNGGKPLDEKSLVGTGTTVTLTSENSSVIASYNIVVVGDVNGDGVISASDYVLIKNSIMGTGKLNNIQKIGANVNKDKEVSASDYVLIKNHIMGTKKLY